MTTGKIVRFDEFRGYGFIAPDDGNEDVFMHANDLRDEKYLFRPGLRVEFKVEDGDRGLKASDVRIVERDDAGPAGPPVTRAAMARSASGEDSEDVLCDVLSAVELRQELTEAFLKAVPSLTGSQLLQARQCVIELAKAHSWVES